MNTTDASFNYAVERRKQLKDLSYNDTNYNSIYNNVSQNILDINTNLLDSYNVINSITTSDSIDLSYGLYDTEITQYSQEKDKLNEAIYEDKTNNALLNEKNVSRSYYLLMIWIIILIIVFTSTIIYIISENNVGFFMMLLLGIVVFYSMYSIIKNIF